MTAFNVSAAYDKPAYNGGATMTVSITGNAVETVVTQEQANLTLSLQSANGATESISAAPVLVTRTTPVNRDVIIVAAHDISGRVWTIAPDGKSVSAVA